MQSHFSQKTKPYSDEEIKQEIAASSNALLNQLNPEYPIYHQTEIIRFGDLPSSEQQALEQALLEQTQGKLVKYQF